MRNFKDSNTNKRGRTREKYSSAEKLYVAPYFMQTAYLPCFGRGLNVGDAIGASELMGLPRVHRARREVTFVSHKDHGNIIGILNTLNLFSALQNKKIENLVYFISLLLFLFLDTSKHFI